MSFKHKMVLGAVTCVLGMGMVGIHSPVRADGAGAFIGGMLAGKVVNNMQRRTEAEEAQADAAQQPQYVQSAPPPQAAAAPAQSSPEQRIKELDKLAAGGYITPQEYKAKKQAIIDSM